MDLLLKISEDRSINRNWPTERISQLRSIEIENFLQYNVSLV